MMDIASLLISNVVLKDVSTCSNDDIEKITKRAVRTKKTIVNIVKKLLKFTWKM